MKLNDLLTTVQFGETTVLDIAGNGPARKITVEARRLLPEEPRPPKRAESQARSHLFLSAASFADYLGKYGTKDTVVFADPVTEQIAAVIDETATKGFEVVTMKPAVHPLWRPWADLAGRSIDLATFTAFLDQNRRTVIRPDQRELRLVFSQVRAAINIDIERGRGKSAVNGLMVRSKIQGVEKNEPVELPEEIVVRAPLYMDTALLEVPLDLSVEASSGGTISVVVSAGTVLDAKVKAFEDMLEVIRGHEDIVAKEMTITFGKPAFAEWKYLPEMPAKVG